MPTMINDYACYNTINSSILLSDIHKNTNILELDGLVYTSLISRHKTSLPLRLFFDSVR